MSGKSVASGIVKGCLRWAAPGRAAESIGESRFCDRGGIHSQFYQSDERRLGEHVDRENQPCILDLEAITHHVLGPSGARKVSAQASRHDEESAAATHAYQNAGLTDQNYL